MDHAFELIFPSPNVHILQPLVNTWADRISLHVQEVDDTVAVAVAVDIVVVDSAAVDMVEAVTATDDQDHDQDRGLPTTEIVIEEIFNWLSLLRVRSGRFVFICQGTLDFMKS